MSGGGVAADADRLKEYVAAILAQAGSSAAEAGVVAQHLVDANLKGHGEFVCSFSAMVRLFVCLSVKETDIAFEEPAPLQC